MINVKNGVFDQDGMLSQADLASHAEYKVRYNSAKDMVELVIGSTSLRISARHFFLMNEVMRKATAKLTLKTQLLELRTTD